MVKSKFRIDNQEQFEFSPWFAWFTSRPVSPIHEKKVIKNHNVLRVVRIELYFRYVERSSVQKKLPIELWLTHPRLRVEKFPPGSLEVVNFIRNKNEDSFTSDQRNTDLQVCSVIKTSVKLRKKNETFTLEELYEAIYPNLPSTEVSLVITVQSTKHAIHTCYVNNFSIPDG